MCLGAATVSSSEELPRLVFSESSSLRVSLGEERFRWSRFLPSAEVLLDGLVDSRFLWRLVRSAVLFRDVLFGFLGRNVESSSLLHPPDRLPVLTHR